MAEPGSAHPLAEKGDALAEKGDAHPVVEENGAPRSKGLVNDALMEIGFGRYQYYVLAIVGIGLLADGMEMFVMSLVLPNLPITWGLNATTRGILGGSVFVGMAIGAPVWGIVSDHFGRLLATMLTLVIALALGLSSALSPGFWCLLILRFGFGFAVGGFVPVGQVLLIESTPPNHGGFGIAMASNLFSLGGAFESLFAVAVLPNLGWPSLLAISASPLAIPLLVAPFLGLVEPPAWHLSRGRAHAAHNSLARISWVNRGELLTLPSAAELADAELVGTTDDGIPSKASAVSSCAASDSTATVAAQHIETRGWGSLKQPLHAKEHSCADDGVADAKASKVAKGPCPNSGPGLLEFLSVGSGPRLALSLTVAWASISFTYYGLVFMLPT